MNMYFRKVISHKRFIIFVSLASYSTFPGIRHVNLSAALVLKLFQDFPVQPQFSPAHHIPFYLLLQYFACLTLFNCLSFSTHSHIRRFSIWGDAQWISQLLLQAWTQSLFLLPISKWLVFSYWSTNTQISYSFCTPRLIVQLNVLSLVYPHNIQNLYTV